MKTNIIIIGANLLSSLVFANDFRAITRDAKYNLVVSAKKSSEIGLDEKSNSLKHFSIYNGMSDTEVDLNNLNKDDELRINTMSYHLNKAYNYFSKMEETATYLRNQGKIGIRYNITSEFSSGKHFIQEEAVYNNAVTHKASNQYILEEEGVKKWGNEIWFRPAKNKAIKIPKGSFSAQTESDPGDDVLSVLDSAVQETTQKVALGYSLKYIDQSHYLSELGMLLLMKQIIPKSLDFASTFYSGKKKLDTSMVPEIIYHEFTHIAMSDFVPLTGSFPISEAMANYFAAVISGNPEIGGNLDKYGKNYNPIKLDKRLMYSSNLESEKRLSHNPFTYNYLWRMRSQVSKKIKIPGQNTAELFDRIVFEARKYIDLSDDLAISKSLPSALKEAASVIAQDEDQAREIRLIISQVAVNSGM